MAYIFRALIITAACEPLARTIAAAFVAMGRLGLQIINPVGV